MRTRRAGWGRTILRTACLAVVAGGSGATGGAAIARPVEAPIQDPAGAPADAAGAGRDTTPFPAGVQEVDRIVAVVGDTAFLLSELRQEMFRLRAQGAQIPPEDSPEWLPFARRMVDAVADQLIILQQAKRAGISPNPQAIDELAERYYQQARSQFATDEEMMRAVEASGMNMLQYRQMLRAQAEAQTLLEGYRISLQQRTDLPPVVVNESEVEAYFEENFRDQTRPAAITFNQLIAGPIPSGASRDSALARVSRARQEVIGGEEFEIVARRYSDEASTREQGGELGWLRRDEVVKPFADAAWGVRPGSVVGPVETRFGLHLIKIENQRGGERFLRHILIRPELKEEDVAAARELAGRLADSLRAGADPERLARLPGVVDENIRFDEVAASQLSSRYPGADLGWLDAPEEGRVYGPYEVEGAGGRPEFVVIQVVRFRPAGPVQLDDLRDGIRREIRLTKQIDAILREIRENTFVDLKL